MGSSALSNTPPKSSGLITIGSAGEEEDDDELLLSMASSSSFVALAVGISSASLDFLSSSDFLQKANLLRFLPPL